MKSGCDTQEVSPARTIPLPVLGNPANLPNQIRKSRTARWRAISLILLTLLMVAHIVQWRLMGTTVSPIEPSEAMYTLQNGAINAGFIFFTLAILSTVIFGRYVCGWGCHIVALQDLCAWLMKKIGITPRPFRSRLLVFVPLIVALYMFVWPTVVRIVAKPADEPLIPNFTNHLITTDFWATFPTVAVAIPFLFVCGFMTVYFMGSKGFCTYACPYGGFFAVADKFASGRIRVTDACNECGHCTATCTSNVTVHAEVKQYGMVVDPGCMKCMDCVSVCPNDALYFGFGKPAVGVKKVLSKNYSLTWPEEIFAGFVFFASFWAVWDVYQLVPMLMALGIATVSTFVALKGLKVVRTTDSIFLKYVLKSNGSLTRAGWIFLTFAFLWIGLNTHSGWVRYHERAGTIAYESVRIPDELALARIDPIRWLSRADVENVETGKQHLNLARDRGLFLNTHALSKLAWLEYLSGETQTAVSLLSEASKRQDGEARALSLYYRGAMLNRLKMYNEASADLDQAIAVRPDLLTAREEKGESLWQLGRRDEAVSVWRELASIDARLPLTNYFLSGAAMLQGRNEMAVEFETLADRMTPNDPLFHWMLGMRLENVGMKELAGRRYNKAIELNPEFKRAQAIELINQK